MLSRCATAIAAGLFAVSATPALSNQPEPVLSHDNLDDAENDFGAVGLLGLLGLLGLTGRRRHDGRH